MIYLLAIVLSLIACCQGLAAEVIAGNIGHVRNGRPPNAGAALFPVIPLAQLFAAGWAWFLQALTPQFAAWILVGCFLALTAIRTVRLAKLRAELARVLAASNKHERGGRGVLLPRTMRRG